jgi:excisionase family DNA binding protein
MASEQTEWLMVAEAARTRGGVNRSTQRETGAVVAMKTRTENAFRAGRVGTRLIGQEYARRLERCDSLLSVMEAAARLGLAPQTIRNWLSLRKLPCVKIGRLTRIPQSAVDQYIAANTIPAVDEAMP